MRECRLGALLVGRQAGSHCHSRRARMPSPRGNIIKYLSWLSYQFYAWWCSQVPANLLQGLHKGAGLAHAAQQAQRERGALQLRLSGPAGG